MIRVEIDKAQLTSLVEAAHKAKKSFKTELKIAVNKAAKKTKLEMGRDIRATINLKKDESERHLRISVEATADKFEAVVELKKTPRLGLRHYGAKQNKKGVTYKISKSGGRRLAEGAFLGPKPGAVRTKWKGNAFKRTGKARLPIVQIKGVSTYGAYVKNNLQGPQVERVRADLANELTRRIKLNVLRASGLVTK